MSIALFQSETDYLSEIVNCNVENMQYVMCRRASGLGNPNSSCRQPHHAHPQSRISFPSVLTTDIKTLNTQKLRIIPSHGKAKIPLKDRCSIPLQFPPRTSPLIISAGTAAEDRRNVVDNSLLWKNGKQAN